MSGCPVRNDWVSWDSSVWKRDDLVEYMKSGEAWRELVGIGC